MALTIQVLTEIQILVHSKCQVFFKKKQSVG